MQLSKHWFYAIFLPLDICTAIKFKINMQSFRLLIFIPLYSSINLIKMKWKKKKKLNETGLSYIRTLSMYRVYLRKWIEWNVVSNNMLWWNKLYLVVWQKSLVLISHELSQIKFKEKCKLLKQLQIKHNNIFNQML